MGDFVTVSGCSGGGKSTLLGSFNEAVLPRSTNQDGGSMPRN
jgi:ABC-type lipoprotein export system ATPase subunit